MVLDIQETIRKQRVVISHVRGVSPNDTRIWPIKNHWGIIIQDSRFQNRDVSFTFKLVYNVGNDEHPQYSMPDAPNTMSLYVNKTSGYYYLRRIGYINRRFVDTMNWEYSDNISPVVEGYLDEISFDELTLNVLDYGVAYDIGTNTLLLLFQNKVIGAVTEEGVTSQYLLEDGVDPELRPELWR